MRRLVPLSGILVLMVTACVTSNGGGAAAGTPETVRVTGAGGAMTAEIHPSDQVRGGDVPAPIDRAWSVLRAVYDSLHLPIASADVSTHTIDTPTLRLRRRLGDVPLSKYLNCGSTQGGQSVDTYEIQLAVRTTLRSHDGTTTILTSVSAEGRPITLATDFARCTTTGNLENRVVDLTAALVR